MRNHLSSRTRQTGGRRPPRYSPSGPFLWDRRGRNFDARELRDRGESAAVSSEDAVSSSAASSFGAIPKQSLAEPVCGPTGDQPRRFERVAARLDCAAEAARPGGDHRAL